MKHVNVIFLCSILSFSFGDFHPDSAGAQTGYKYAYLVLSSRDQAQIAFFDATGSSSEVEYRVPPLVNEWEIPGIRVPSPDGQWVVFASARRGEDSRLARFVQLVNLHSREVRDLESGLVGDVRWSPDSRYLALSQYQTEVNDLFVYSIEGESTRNLTNDTASNNFISWSPDSAFIATVSESLRIADAPVLQLDVIEVSTGNRQTSPNFADFAPIGGLSCNLDWSPDARYVSFVMGCFVSAYFASEVFVWDTSNSELTQATNFTVGAFDPDGTQLSESSFVPAWYDSDTLLIGASYRTHIDQPSTEETYLYRRSTVELVALFEGRTEEWARNSFTGQMAARIVTTAEATSVNDNSPNSIVSGEVQIFALDSSGVDGDTAILSVTASDLPVGCDLAWSPDGATLAYAIRDSDNCDGDVLRLVFVDGTTGTMQEYAPLLENGETPYRALLIGWVAG
jgi:Tol biopolymer transport system component